MTYVSRTSRSLAVLTAVLLGTSSFGAAAAVAPGTAASASAGASIAVTEMTAERQQNPLGLDVERPRFGWRLTSDERAQAQSAYRIMVASGPDALAAGDADVWDSGRVESSQTSQVEYAGPELQPRTRYHWKVQVWGADGSASGWSEPAWWETGVMDGAQLDAAWIGHEIEDRLPRSNTAENVPAELGEGATLGQTFTTDQPFVTAEAKAPTWNSSDSGVTMTLYRNGPDGEQVARHVAENVADNAWVGVTVDEPLEPATYYLEMSDPVGTVGWWSQGEDVYAHGEAFAGGEPQPSDRTFRWEPVVAEADGRSPQLRTEFDLDKPVARARVYASALGVYELNINGSRVGDHRLAPGWTDYNTRVQYQTYDVTEMVRQGGNAIAAATSPGWYAGHVAIFGPNQYGTQPWFLAQLEVTYTDGTRAVVATDESWRSATGPVLTSDMLMGETYDAREETAGWTRPGFDDGSWAPVVVNSDVDADVVAQADPPVRVTEEITPVEITEPEDGVYVVDMGQNMVGTVRLRVDGPGGTTVKLRHAEVLNEDGTIYTANLRTAAATDRYTLAGDGEEVYEPLFTFHGFRYVEVTGLPEPPDLDTVTGLVMHTDAPLTSSFESSDPMLDQLFSNIVWGQRGNFLSIPTDTPARDERMGWTGDINVFVGAAAYNMDVGPFLRKWLQDLRDAQFDNGAFTDVAPIVGFLGGGSAGWGDAGVTVPYTLWQRYGDLRVLEEHYPAMQAWIDYLIEHSDGYLRPAEGYGDWLNVEDETPKDVIGTAYFAHSAALVAEMASALGEDADARRYEQLAADVRAAFVNAYVGADGRVDGDSQTAYVLALGFDLVPDELRAAAADRLVGLIEARDWHLSTGFLGTPDLLPVLTETGHTDVAYRLITQDTYPSWGYQIANGATTMWEHWDSIRPDGTFEDPAMNSFNHYAYGAVGEWMFRTIAGIQHAEPGFGTTVIKPRPGGGLDHVSASYDSAAGEVATSWRDSQRSFDLDVTVPVNTTAEVWVPATTPGGVTESGAPVSDAEGVAFDRMEDGHAVYRVGSGDYRFVSDHALGHLDLAEQAVDRLGDELDRVEGELTDDHAEYLAAQYDTVVSDMSGALRAYRDGDDGAAVRQVHRALTDASRIIDWLTRRQDAGEVPSGVAEPLRTAMRAVQDPLSAVSSLLLGVSSELTAAAGSVVAGDEVEVTAAVHNSGDERVQGVELGLDVPDGWSARPQGQSRTGTLAPGSSFTAVFAVTAPLSQPVTDDVAISGTSTFMRAGGRAQIPLSTTLDVVSPVAIGDMAADPRIIDEPGTPSTVTATLTNRSGSAIDGDVQAAAPDGWTVEPSARSYELPPGESRSVTFEIGTPDEPAAGEVSLTATYGDHVGDTSSVRLTHSLGSWLFETDGDAEGWQPANLLDGFEVAGGLLRTSSAGGDPYMVNDQVLSVDAADGVTVEITMETSVGSGGQVFWTSASEPFFSEGKSTKFTVEAGTHTYRVPVRAFDGTLTGLRLDPLQTSGDIAVDAIRIVR